jgi:hypothetical protein
VQPHNFHAQQGLTLGSLLCCLKFSIVFEQMAPHAHFAWDSANYTANSKDKYYYMSFKIFYCFLSIVLLSYYSGPQEAILLNVNFLLGWG